MSRTYTFECGLGDIVYVVDTMYFDTLDTKDKEMQTKYGTSFDAFFYAIKKYKVYKIEMTSDWISYIAEEELQKTLEELTSQEQETVYIPKKRIALYNEGNGKLWTTDLEIAKEMAKKYNYNQEWLNNPFYHEEKKRLMNLFNNFIEEELRDIFYD